MDRIARKIDLMKFFLTNLPHALKDRMTQTDLAYYFPNQTVITEEEIIVKRAEVFAEAMMDAALREGFR